MLPAEPTAERAEVVRQAKSDLLLMYQLGERLFRARIPAGSILINRPLAESTLREKYGLNVVAIERNGGTVLAPTPDIAFKEGDVMLLEGRLEEFRQRDVEPYLEILPMRKYNEPDLESAQIVVLEVVLSPRSQLVGQTLKETHFREKYGMTVLAIWNGERVFRTGLQDLKLAYGDSLLLQGPRSKLPVLRLDRDLIVLSSEEDEVKRVTGKGWLALAIFGTTVLVAAVGPFAVGEVCLVARRLRRRIAADPEVFPRFRARRIVRGLPQDLVFLARGDVGEDLHDRRVVLPARQVQGLDLERTRGAPPPLTFPDSTSRV